MRVELRLSQVGDLERLTVKCGPTDQSGFPVDCYRPQLLQQSGSASVGGTDVERVARLVVLHDRSAVGSGELYCVADDPIQDLVEIEARADRLADLPERYQLIDLALQLLFPGVECEHQVP